MERTDKVDCFMTKKRRQKFDPKIFLVKIGDGRDWALSTITAALRFIVHCKRRIARSIEVDVIRCFVLFADSQRDPRRISSTAVVSTFAQRFRRHQRNLRTDCRPSRRHLRRRIDTFSRARRYYAWTYRAKVYS